MKYKSASMQIVEFLKQKPTGFEFTAEQLMEDINTTPGEEPIASVGAFNGCLVKQRKHGALSARAIRGKFRRPAYMYALLDHSKLYAVNRSSIGSKPGRKFAHKGTHAFHLEEGNASPDLFPTVAEATAQPLPHPGNEPPDTSADAKLLDAASPVRYHLREAFRAYKRQCIAGFEAKYDPLTFLQSLPTEDLMAELSRRIKANAEVQDAKTKVHQQDGS